MGFICGFLKGWTEANKCNSSTPPKLFLWIGLVAYMLGSLNCVKAGFFFFFFNLNVTNHAYPSLPLSKCL